MSNLSNRTRRYFRKLNPTEPCREELMMKHHMENTLCAVLREIYCLTDNEEVKYKARVAMTMAKKMDYQLGEYKAMFR